MAVRVEAGPTFAPVANFARSLNLEGPVRMGGSLSKVNSLNSTFGPKLNEAPLFRAQPQITPETRVKSFQPSDFRTEVRFNLKVEAKPELKAPLKVEAPEIKIQDFARPKRGGARFNTEFGLFRRAGDQGFLKPKLDLKFNQSEVKLSLTEATPTKIRGRNRLVRHFQATPELKPKLELKTQVKDQPQVEAKPKVEPEAEVKVEPLREVKVEKREEREVETQRTKKKVAIELVDQKDKEAFDARTAASLEAFHNAREISPIVDGGLVAALHPDQYSYSKRLRSGRLQHRVKSDGSYALYIRAIRNYRRQIVTTAEAESLFRQFNEGNTPVETVARLTERRVTNKEVAKVESGLEEEITPVLQ